MLRIRFHGRGGQGIKTASQMIGTAAYLSGFQAQDFPLYGAERRGAPITAYARIDRDPIRERGPIIRPDLLLVGDETLLEDPLAAPLAGTNGLTCIFINSSHSAPSLQEHFHLASTPVVLNLGELCTRHLKRETILSTALAAAAARLTGWIPLARLNEAVRQELEEAGFREEVIQKNLNLAKEVYEALPVGTWDRSAPASAPVTASRLVALKHDASTEAAPIIRATGNMTRRHTGNWRTHRPVVGYDLCNGCGICYARCPDGDIRLGPDGKPIIDYNHCKGCLICATECPKHAIQIVKEVTSWN